MSDSEINKAEEASLKRLEEKIAIMQVAAAGGGIYAKNKTTSKWDPIDKPEFNWGFTDYKVEPAAPAIIENAADTSLDYTQLHGKLSDLERGKNLVDVRDYTSSTLRDSKGVISTSLNNLNIDWTAINESSLAGTQFYDKLIQMSYGDQTLLDSYIKEIQDAAKGAIQENIKNEAMALVNQSIDAQIGALPLESSMYESTVPSTEELKQTVSEMSAQISEAYSTLEDRQMMELEKNGITMKLWKNMDDKCALSVSYNLEKSVAGELPPVIEVSKNPGVNISVVSVTLEEMNNAINTAASDTIQKLTKNYEDLYQKIKSEVIEELKNDNPMQTALDEYQVSVARTNIDLDTRDELLRKKVESAYHGIAKGELDKAIADSNSDLTRLVIDTCHPIGSSYSSISSDNPSALFGGFWSRYPSTNDTNTWIRTETQSPDIKSQIPTKNSVYAKNLPFSYGNAAGNIFYYIANTTETISIGVYSSSSLNNIKYFIAKNNVPTEYSVSSGNVYTPKKVSVPNPNWHLNNYYPQYHNGFGKPYYPGDPYYNEKYDPSYDGGYYGPMDTDPDIGGNSKYITKIQDEFVGNCNGTYYHVRNSLEPGDVLVVQIDNDTSGSFTYSGSGNNTGKDIRVEILRV